MAFSEQTFTKPFLKTIKLLNLVFIERLNGYPEGVVSKKIKPEVSNVFELWIYFKIMIYMYFLFYFVGIFMVFFLNESAGVPCFLL